MSETRDLIEGTTIVQQEKYDSIVRVNRGPMNKVAVAKATILKRRSITRGKLCELSNVTFVCVSRSPVKR